MQELYVGQCLIIMLPIDIKTTSQEEALVLETLVRVIEIWNRTKKKCSKSMFAKTAPSLNSESRITVLLTETCIINHAAATLLIR